VVDSVIATSSGQALSPNEAILWHAEGVRSQFHPWFGVLLVLGRQPEATAFEATVARTMERIPRMRQRVSVRGLGIGLPEWRNAGSVEIRYHVRRLRLQPDADLASALGALAVIAALPMDRGRPLWECYLLGPLVGGRALCLFKFHGALIDSIDLADLVATLTSDSKKRSPRRPRAGANGTLRSASGLLAREGARETWRLAKGALRASARAFRHPVDALDSVWRGAQALPEAMSEAAESVVRELEGTAMVKPVRAFDLLTVPAAHLDTIAAPLGVAPEDILLSALTTAVRSLKPPAARRVVETVCLSRLRKEGAAASKGGPEERVLISLPLPIGERREARRLALIRDARHAGVDRGSGMSSWIAHALGLLPRAPGGWVAGYGLGRPDACFVDAGRFEPWGSIAEADVEASYCFSDLAETASVGATILRCGPLVHVGISGDAGLPTDSRSFRGLFETALSEIEQLADRFARGGRRYAGGVTTESDC
jgi:diacylglycerol O-acyltransferase